MSLKTAVLPGLVLFSLIQAGPDKGSRTESYDDPEAYAVYAEVLPKIWNWELHEPPSLVFQEETESHRGGTVKDLCVKGDAEFQKAWGSTLKAYVSVNQTSKRLQRHFPIDKSYVLVSKGEIYTLIRQSNWDGFYARYPEAKSFVSVSAVGFNTEKTKAMLTMTYQCGSLCMEGTYYLMEKKNGKWVQAHLTKVISCAWAS